VAAPDGCQGSDGLSDHLADAVSVRFAGVLLLQLDESVDTAEREFVPDRLQIDAHRHGLAQVDVERLALAFGQALENRIVQVNKPLRPACVLSDHGVIITSIWRDVVRHAADAATPEPIRDDLYVSAGDEHVLGQVSPGLRDVEILDLRVVVVGKH
jgi:hypothetical protein